MEQFSQTGCRGGGGGNHDTLDVGVLVPWWGGKAFHVLTSANLQLVTLSGRNETMSSSVY